MTNMKRLIKVIFLVVMLIGGLLIYRIFIYRMIHNNHRAFATYIESVGYKIKFTEIESDTILHFVFNRPDSLSRDSIDIFSHNVSDDVVSFVFVEGIDTIYIRKDMEFYEMFPPEEKTKYNCAPPPKDYKIFNPIIGELPSKCKYIAFSDSTYFKYEYEHQFTYIPKDSHVHIIILEHQTERTDSYSLYDITENDTVEVKIRSLGEHR